MAAPSFSNTVREYKTVRLWRTPAGFGFSLTGQYPCVLTHVVEGSPAFKAGLKVGDYLIMVNGLNVVKHSHDAVVAMVAGCVEYVILQVAQRTTASPSATGVHCTCSLNCQSISVPYYNVPGQPPQPGYPQQAPAPFDCCGVVYVGFLKLPLPANANNAVFTRLLSTSLNHFLTNKSLILMHPLILSANRQAICLTDSNNKAGGYNFILNSVAFVGTIPESPSNMFGLVLHCPPNPICVCHLFSTSLTRQQEQYLRLKTPSYYSAPDVVRYLSNLIASVVRNQPLCDSSNYPNINAANQACPNPRRVRGHQPPSFEAEIFIDNFQFPAGGVYTVSERNALLANGPTHGEEPQRVRGYSGKPPRHIGRVTSNTSSASSATHHTNDNPSANGTFEYRQAAMALARSRSLSRYNRKGVRGGSSRSSGSDDGRFGRGGGSSGGSGSFRVRYGSQRHRHNKSDRHRRRQDSLSGGSASGARLAISDETTTTTSTTTASSSVVASSRRHYGHLWQSGSQYRSRSIDSLVNASKEDQQPAIKPGIAPHDMPKNSAAFFSQQQQVIIDGPYIQVDQIDQQHIGASAYGYGHQHVSTDGSGLALNSLLSPRYNSFGTNASETDLDYEESTPLEADAAISAAAASKPTNAHSTRSTAIGVQNQLPDGNAVDNRKRQTDAIEARSSTASVETRTEVAGSTLSLPISSASTAGHKCLASPITFEGVLQDKMALELFKKFLKSQVSDENLEFMLACDNFRSLPASNELLVSEAKMIYHQFVSQHSKQPVNLTWQIVSSIRRALLANNIRIASPTSPSGSNNNTAAMSAQQQNSELPRDIFDTARDHVYRLLKKDCYPRFMQSEYYRELTGEKSCSADSGTSLPSVVDSNGALKSSALRLSSRKNRNRNAGNTAAPGSASSATTSYGSNNGISWNPAKLLSNIIGRAKNKPTRSKGGSSIASQAIRVTFPDGSIETVATDEIKSGLVTSLSDYLGPLCASRGLSVFLCAIYQHGSEQPIDSQLSAASFNGRDLIIEQQAAFVVFYFSGSSPACRRLLVRAKPSRRIVDVLQWDERKGDDAVIVKEVWCLDQAAAHKSDTVSQQPLSFTKINISSNFEGLVRDVENRFVIAVTAGRSETYDSAAVCNLVKTHFDTNHLPKFEDVLNAVTSSHSWHTFDEYGRINLSKAISSHWRNLRVALAIGESPELAVNSRDESDYLEGDDLLDCVSSLDQLPETPNDPLVVNEPRSRRPILSSCSSTSFTDSSVLVSSSKPAAVQCRLVRGAHPLSEILSEQQYYGRNSSPSSVEASFNNERIFGVNNMNYEVIEAQSNRVGRFVRIGSAGELGGVCAGGSGTADGSPGRENVRHPIGYDENSSCMLNEEAFLGLNNQASPYARRLPKPMQMPRAPVMNEEQQLMGGGLRSSTPSPSTHRLVLQPHAIHVERSPASTSIKSMRSEQSTAAVSTIRITESTL